MWDSEIYTLVLNHIDINLFFTSVAIDWDIAPWCCSAWDPLVHWLSDPVMKTWLVWGGQCWDDHLWHWSFTGVIHTVLTTISNYKKYFLQTNVLFPFSVAKRHCAYPNKHVTCTQYFRSCTCSLACTLLHHSLCWSFAVFLGALPPPLHQVE